MKPRWYQQESFDKTIEYIENNAGNPLIVAPTGAGKSLILAMLSAHFVDKFFKVLIVSHVESILLQNTEAVKTLVPEEIVGIFSAGIGKRQRRRVTIAGIQSIHRIANLFSMFDYVIIDEAHTIPHTGEGMYRNLLNALPEARVIGLTATPYRMTTGLLHDGKGAMFSDISFTIPVERLIKEGFLSPLLTRGTKNKLDTEGIKLIGKDFSKKEMSEKFDITELTEKIIVELVPNKTEYKHWLLFAISIDHAEHIAEELNKKGIPAVFVHSKMGKVEKLKAIDLFKRGTVQALVNVSMLTTGFDFPSIDLIGLIRPTRSPGLHVQMIGRGLRIAESKKHCLILDFAGNILRLGPINDVRVPERKKKGENGTAPVKECPECFTHLHAAATVCYICGYVYPEKTPELTVTSTNLEAVLLNTAKENKKPDNGWYNIKHIEYKGFMSKQRRPSIRVQYTIIEGNVVNEFINPFGNTQMAHNNRHWWKVRTNIPLPASISRMLLVIEELKKPKMININFKGRYPRINDAKF